MWLNNRGHMRLALRRPLRKVWVLWNRVTVPTGTPSRSPSQSQYHSWPPSVPTVSDQRSHSFHYWPECPESRMENRYFFVGETGATFMATWNGEMFNHQREDFDSFELMFPPMRLRWVWRMPTSQLLLVAKPLQPLTWSSSTPLGCRNNIHWFQPGSWVSW